MRNSSIHGLFVVFFLSIGTMLFAQGSHRISGQIVDMSGKDPLVGATIWLPVAEKGTTTGLDGEFELDLTSTDEVVLVVSYIGYLTDTIVIDPTKNERITIELSPGLLLEEVIVSDKRSKAAANFERTRMSYIDLSMKEINFLPALLSENDVLKAVQLLPGIQSAEGAATGYYVRGGSSDQNLILLNDAVIYNPFHAAGFISIFNGDIVKDISIHKTAFPAKYGGRLSSHLQVNTKEPSFEKVTGKAGIGVVTARITVETPIVKDKLALTLSGRGFYSYSLFRALASEELKKDLPNYYFYDAFAQLTWKPTEKDRINAYYYRGQDLVAFQDKSTSDSTAFNIPWSNSALGLNWKRMLKDNVATTVSAYYSTYNFVFESDHTYGGQGLSTAIKEWGGKISFDHQMGDHFLNYGMEVIRQTIQPNVTRDVNDGSTGQTTRIADVVSYYTPLTSTVYFNDDWKATERLGINYGIRIPFFVGNGAAYYSVDPKIVMRYKLNEFSSLKASYSYGSQFVHMLVNSTATTPLDLWIGSSQKVKPQRSHSVALGWYQNFAKNMFEVSVEGYYKALQNQIEYDEGVEVFSEQNIEDKLLFGKGWTYGTEFFLRKRTGKVTGFVGYTLSWAKRQFDELNGGNAFNYKYDRRHDLTTSLSYQITDKWSVSALFVIGSGQALTVPQGVIYSPRSQGSGTYVYDYGERNSFRLKPYHRVDLSVKYSSKPKRVQSHIKIDIYNLYNRKNAFFVILDSKETSGGGEEVYLREYALIPITPSISYQLEF